MRAARPPPSMSLKGGVSASSNGGGATHAGPPLLSDWRAAHQSDATRTQRSSPNAAPGTSATPVSVMSRVQNCVPEIPPNPYSIAGGEPGLRDARAAS